ncbi:MAG: DUF3160 domain-containing protein [Patescibacteria group bacterium]|nr:DUF3160 domain-containing protein [Patescibacteria group bacterium]
MFIDKNKTSQFSTSKDSKASILEKTWFKVAGISVISLSIVAIALVVFLNLRNKKQAVIETGPKNTDLTSLLPTDIKPLENSENSNNNSLVQAEKVFFGNYYQEIKESFTAKKKDSDLPLDVKVDAANYYPLSREINLDNVVNNLNTNGFAVIDNPYEKEAKDFYSIYNIISQKQLPFLITSDFMYYYYQTFLKRIYKSIETDVFYSSFWDLNKEMFEQADQRYRERYVKVGILNDPILEGLRLEAVYFAMNLELLKPRLNQVIPIQKDSVKPRDYLAGNFTNLEAEKYSFTAPDYLNPTIKSELALIDKAGKYNKDIKSPALLYERDYNEFKIPLEYQYTPKLNNLFQAIRWTKSLFPLYYKDADCPSCFLDKQDWYINQAAAHLIARDLYQKQAWQNKWAKVYKAIGFFSNIRSELAYIEYDQAFRELYPNKTVEDVFDNSNPSRNTDLEILKNKIADNDYDPAKGGLNRQTEVGKRESGMRILQDDYDPTEFFYSKLLYDKVGNYINYQTNKVYPGLNTLCDIKADTKIRCRGIALDLINPTFNEPITTDYFAVNTKYENYANQVPLLRSHFANFNEVDWHKDAFWSNYNIGRKFLNSRRQDNFPHTESAAWVNRVLETVESANLSIGFSSDHWISSVKKEVKLSTAPSKVIAYHYIEPNLDLISEMLANTKMIFNVFVKLDLVKQNNGDFKELIEDLEVLRLMVIKENKGEDFSYNDWLSVNNLISKYYVDSLGVKERKISFNDPINDPNALKAKTLKQSISKLKILAEVHKVGDRDVIFVGPAFSYWEEK